MLESKLSIFDPKNTRSELDTVLHKALSGWKRAISSIPIEFGDGISKLKTSNERQELGPELVVLNMLLEVFREVIFNLDETMTRLSKQNDIKKRK